MLETKPARIEVGVFDHLDDSGRELGRQYNDRLEIAAACDRSGPTGWHRRPTCCFRQLPSGPTRCGWAQWSCWLNLYHPLRAFEEIIPSMKREASRPDPQVIATRSAKSAQSETNQSFRRSYFEGLKFGKHGVLHVGRPAPFPA
jgi:hypothetical protein